jgi:hypothetical protein
LARSCVAVRTHPKVPERARDEPSVSDRGASGGAPAASNRPARAQADPHVSLESIRQNGLYICSDIERLLRDLVAPLVPRVTPS